MKELRAEYEMETDDGAWRLAFEDVFLGPLRLGLPAA